MQSGLADVVLSGAMFSLMFAMGLTLTVDDFRRIARAPRPTLVGTIMQLMVMPLIGLGFARLFDLPILLTAGMVVLAACPGGMFSNMFVHVARGHTALSITLTATATLVTLFTLPLWVQIALAGADGSVAPIDMPILDTALRLGMLTILPIGLGMILRAHHPAAVRWETWLARVSFVVILIGAGLDGMDRPEPPIEEFRISVAPVMWYTLSVVAAGVLVPVLARISARDGATIAVELVVKNTLLGIVLLTQAVDFVAIVPILIYMVVQTPAGIALLVGWRLLAKHGFVAPLPAAIPLEPIVAGARASARSSTAIETDASRLPQSAP